MMTNQDVRPEGLQQNCIDNDNEPEQAVPQLETPWLHGNAPQKLLTASMRLKSVHHNFVFLTP